MFIRTITVATVFLLIALPIKAQTSPVLTQPIEGTPPVMASVDSAIDTSRRTVSVRYKGQDTSTRDGNKPPSEQQIEISGQGAIAIPTKPGDRSVLQTDAHQPQRWLVRLKDQPLRPYLKQQRKQLAGAAKLSRAQHQQLAKAATSYRQQLQKRQSDTLGEMRKQKLLHKVHHQFTQLTNTLNITADQDQIERIRRLPQVAEVYPDSKVSAFLADSVALTDAPILWTMQDSGGVALTGRGVTVAILDTGIDYTHPDLGGCIGAGCKVAGGYNFIEWEDPTNFIDKHGHGTHVAGIVAAKGGLTGMAPDVTLYAYKVLTDSGWGTDSSIIAALEKSVDPDGDPLTDDQIDIVNMSLGGPGAPDSPISEAANNAMQAGVLVIVAAGNSGSNYSTIGSPGNAVHVLTVGAIDNNGSIAGFSSRGPITGQTYVKPEIVAPGVEINSAQPGGSYVRLSGTSMATPHVAGGAALLKQRFPALTAAELKSLLINNSTDLGVDAFTQGAGMMKLLPAVTASLLVSPALLSAGSVDTSQTDWLSNIPVTVKNISPQAVALALQAPTSYPPGTSALISPATSQLLAAGQDVQFDLQLMVNTRVLPYADTPTLHHEVSAHVQSEAATIRVPLVFSKATKLRLEFAGAPWIVEVFTDDGSYSAINVFNSCTESPQPYTVDVKPGTYNVAAVFYNDDCGIDAMVFKENIEVGESSVVTVDRATAIHQLGVGTITDEQGSALALEGMSNINKEFFWHIPDSNNGRFFFLGGSTPEIMWVSDTSDKIKIEVSSFFGLPQTLEGVAGRYFLLSDTFVQGVRSEQLLDLDLRAAGAVDFSYRDEDVLASGVTFTVGASQIRSLLDVIAIGTSLTRPEAYFQPIEATAYAAISTLENGEWYPEFGVNHYDSDPMAWSRELMRTGPIAFLDTSSYTKLKGAFSVVDDTNYRSDSRALVVADSAYILAAEYWYYPVSHQLEVKNLSSGYSFSVQRDLQQNNFFDAMPYRQYCDGTLVNQAETNGSNFTALYTAQGNTPGCSGLIALELDQPTRFLGRFSQSTTRVELDAAAANATWDYVVHGPVLQQLDFRSDGISKRVLNGDDLEVKLRATDSYNESLSLAEGQVSLEYRLEGEVGWTALNITQVGNDYFAKLPVIAGTHLGSLRISLRNSRGVSQINTLNGVFMLGVAAEGELVQRPVFEPLPPLIIEATGPETPVQLPAVTAKDAVDGDILAVTNNSGSYPIGDHLIRWEATNSLGKKTSAVQLLSIRDTTPPEILVPPNVRATATGYLTEVDLGQARAVDLVDGELTPWLNHSGGFLVGVQTVSWQAYDSRGNIGTGYQQVTIDPMPSSSSVASSSMAAVSSIATSETSAAASSIATASSVATSQTNAAASSIARSQPASNGGGGGYSGIGILAGLLVIWLGFLPLGRASKH